MKPAVLFTVALLSWEAASLVLPVREQEIAATKPLPLSGGAEALSLRLVNDVSVEKHMEKRADWKDWAPSAKCTTCIALCMSEQLRKEFSFTYKVTKLTTAIMGEFSICGTTCILSGQCFGKDKDEADPFYTQSEAGRITSEYKEMKMIEDAGSSSPTHA
ncbi:hypothetical protein K505DRAFT_367944 [Melanomma pulvis-pyrius CBS 109.77]|uniref:Uncharacterized protein n=1 Tax=Melanomma pulvis-pyrius CBS 109.77 TaxID=1314802 RepID=A0A6A6WS41_9PLEO|nr:hypothetical protein K505DRAFT_367944 [Melanomma pulvis-pyrius CBS 109.77]